MPWREKGNEKLKELLEKAGRQLLLMQASDWPFVRRDDALLRIFAADGTRPLPQISAYLIVETGRATFALAADRVPDSAIVTRSAPGRVRALDREMDEITVPLLTDVVP